METEITTRSKFPNEGKTIVEQILASEEKNTSERALMWESVWNPNKKVNHLNKVIWERAEFIRFISSTRIGEPVLMMDVKVSKGKHICSWDDWENLIYVK